MEKIPPEEKGIIKLILRYLYLLFDRVFRYHHHRHHHGSGSGGSGSGSHHYHRHHHRHHGHHHHSHGCYESICLLRKVGDNSILGKNTHRAGWILAHGSLGPYDDENGILFDDFGEQNFCYNSKPEIYSENWVSIFHHPPFPPSFSNQREWMSYYTNTPEFKESMKYLKMAFCLSEYQAKHLRTHLDRNIPIVTLKHPTIDGFQNWSISNWHKNKEKSLVQIGFYLRNTQIINQVNIDKKYSKKRLWSNRKWVNDYDANVINYWGNKRKYYKTTTDVGFLSPSSYDSMLAFNVVIMEAFDASACNVILDCISRNTPLIINPHPAIVEYLGKDYPLYFKHPDEVNSLMNKIEKANIYMKNMDKSDLTLDVFSNKIMENIRTIKI